VKEKGENGRGENGASKRVETEKKEEWMKVTEEENCLYLYIHLFEIVRVFA
jgi:hypothetical protein